ncbi:MAG TPA: hypothetical protein VIK72_19555 [Clostridiaceae bacterium]
MLEARISYINGRTHIVEANNVEMLKSKCKPFIEDKNVYDIWVVKLEGVGWLKSELSPELL